MTPVVGQPHDRVFSFVFDNIDIVESLALSQVEWGDGIISYHNVALADKISCTSDRQ